MRERVRHTGLNAPHKRDVMFCAPYLHVSDSRVRLMPSEMEYDIFARTDTESASWFTGHVIESEGAVMGVSADWFIYFAAYFLCVFVQLDTANATKPSQRISVQLSAALWTPPPLSGSPPNSPHPCFCSHCFVCRFLSPYVLFILLLYPAMPYPVSF